MLDRNLQDRRIKAILFDMVGVLIFPKSNYKTDQTVEYVEELLSEGINDVELKRKIQADHKIDEEKFQDLIRKIINKYETFPALWKVLPELRKSYKLAIINNGTRFTIPIFKSTFGFDDYFDVFLNSAMERVKKPDIRIYILASERLRVNPKECLFMDDDLINIEGANRTGMASIWWKDRESGYQTFLDFITSQRLPSE
jgi:HAD superfamily hydrolase (TIGR01509 family)